MNKHLKPGVAVDVRGASDEVKEQVMAAFVAAGFEVGLSGVKRNFVVCGESSKTVYLTGYTDYEFISINQALGRESEVEKNDQSGFASRCVIVGKASLSNDWFERRELPPVGTVCQIAASTEYLHISYPEGSKVKVYSNFTDDRGVDLAAFVCQTGDIGGVAIAECFRPLKTEKEKFVERLKEHFENYAPSFYEKHYDIGLRFTE